MSTVRVNQVTVGVTGGLERDFQSPRPSAKVALNRRFNSRAPIIDIAALHSGVSLVWFDPSPLIAHRAQLCPHLDRPSNARDGRRDLVPEDCADVAASGVASRVRDG